MSKKRKQYSNDFKAKVALAAIRGDETVPKPAERYGLHPTQINSWKRHLIEQATELFSRGNNNHKENERSVDGLHRVIGQLTVERKNMVEPHNHLSKRKQCQLLNCHPQVTIINLSRQMIKS